MRPKTEKNINVELNIELTVSLTFLAILGFLEASWLDLGII